MLLVLLSALLGCSGGKTIVGDDTGGGTVENADSDDADSDGYLTSVDCDDTDATVHPGAAEVWYDGVDQDCDGADDDQDGDAHVRADDCDDTDPAVYPGAGEVPDDGVDQDCDGADSVSGTGDDADGDGFETSVDCNDADSAIHPGATDAPGDGIDQDCDGVDDSPSADMDGDGWANESFGGTDCDDADAAVNPGEPETIGDDVDSDCDGADYGVDGLASGDLVISEIMYDPDVTSDADGEWFEVYNDTGHIVNLNGLVGADDSAYGAADIFTVEEDLLAGVGERVVFAVNGDSTQNGGVTADYDYAGGGVNLNNSADELYIGVSAGGAYTTIDSVGYDELAGWTAVKGFSLELKDTAVNATSNDTASNWCQATGAMSGGDRGSPGAVSSGC